MGKLRLVRKESHRQNRKLHNLIGIGLLLAGVSVYGGTTYYFYLKRQTAEAAKAPSQSPQAVTSGLGNPPPTTLVKKREDLTAVAAPDPSAPAPGASAAEIARTEALVRQQVQAIRVARAQLAAAELARTQLHNTYNNLDPNSSNSATVMTQYAAADQTCAKAKAHLDLLLKGFTLVNDNYHRAGGRTIFTP